MSIRYLGFLLLLGLPGALRAQAAAQPCLALILDWGYVVPEQESYYDGTTIFYSCDSGRKPVVEGWWAAITCENGAWSHEPQCIDETACLLPEIPHAKYSKKPNEWYSHGSTIRVSCDSGYELKDRSATAVCDNGSWSSLPVCEISDDSCGEPPKIPHAVIIGQKYQEVFAADSEVQYECKNGYSAEQAERKTIICIAGNWTEATTCRSSITTDMDNRDSKPSIMPVNHCGAQPVIENGDIVQAEPTFLKYQCNAFYTHEGPDTVTCYNDGTWSQLPSCREAFCVLDLSLYAHLGIVQTGKEYVKEGEGKLVNCHGYTYKVRFTCSNGKITNSRCCYASYYTGIDERHCY